MLSCVLCVLGSCKRFLMYCKMHNKKNCSLPGACETKFDILLSWILLVILEKNSNHKRRINTE